MTLWQRFGCGPIPNANDSPWTNCFMRKAAFVQRLAVRAGRLDEDLISCGIIWMKSERNDDTRQTMVSARMSRASRIRSMPRSGCKTLSEPQAA